METSQTHAPSTKAPLTDLTPVETNSNNFPRCYYHCHYPCRYHIIIIIIIIIISMYNFFLMTYQAQLQCKNLKVELSQPNLRQLRLLQLKLRQQGLFLEVNNPIYIIFQQHLFLQWFQH